MSFPWSPAWFHRLPTQQMCHPVAPTEDCKKNHKIDKKLLKWKYNKKKKNSEGSRNHKHKINPYRGNHHQLTLNTFMKNLISYHSQKMTSKRICVT